MANEETPLTDAASVISENLTQAGETVQESVTQYVNEARNGNTSIRGLALFSGLGLIVSSLYEIVTGIIQFKLNSVLIAIYSFLMGSMAIAMEVDPESLPYGKRIRAWLLKYIGIVQLSTGRGLFYLVAGSLELTQNSWLATIIGAFTSFVAIVYMAIGFKAERSAKKMREQNFPERVLKRKFNSFDKDSDGKIVFKEFHLLLQSLQVEATYQESEMIYVSLDRDMDGGLTYEEFERFWVGDPLASVPV